MRLPLARGGEALDDWMPTTTDYGTHDRQLGSRAHDTEDQSRAAVPCAAVVCVAMCIFGISATLGPGHLRASVPSWSAGAAPTLAGIRNGRAAPSSNATSAAAADGVSSYSVAVDLAAVPAIREFLAERGAGCYAGPLRMLAMEVFEKLRARLGAGAVGLWTGEVTVRGTS